MIAWADSHAYAAFSHASDEYTDEQRAVIDAGLEKAQDVLAPLLRGQALTSADATRQADISDALTRAACTQYDYSTETGDTTGAGALYTSTTAGPVTLVRSSTIAASESRSVQLLSPVALGILRGAGLGSMIVGHL